MDIVICFLSSGGGKPDKPLGDYIDRVLKMKKRLSSQKVSESFYACCELIVRYITDSSILRASAYFVTVGSSLCGASKTGL